MKKLILVILIAVCTTAAMSAMSLKEAFAALSNIPHVSVIDNTTPLPASIKMSPNGSANPKIAAACRLDMLQVLESGDAAFTILNQVPLKFMINGANNNEVGVFIYATPAGEDRYDCLVAAMSGYVGDLVFVYMTVDETTVDAFQNAKVTMKGSTLTLIPEKESKSSAFDISLSGPE